MDVLFNRLDASYNKNNYDLLAVAVCDDSGNAENIGLISSHCYSVLGIDSNSKQLRLRDPFGQSDFEQSKDGIFTMSFGEFVQYFGSLIVCHSDDRYKEARQVVDISFNKELKKVTVPILKLTVPNGAKVEYVGLSQKANSTPIDMTTFVIKSNKKSASKSNKIDLSQDELFGFMPMTSERNKFVKFGCSENESKTNDISSGCAWKVCDDFDEGSYFLVPWTSEVQWNEAQESKQSDDDSVRYIGLTVHGECAVGDFEIEIVDGLNGNEIDPILMAFAFKYGQKKQWADLERRHFQCGQLDIYCGKNVCDDKKLLFSMTLSEATNVTNAIGFDEFAINKAKEFEIGCDESVLFAVNVPKDPSEPYSAVYKYGLKNEYL